MGKGGRCVRLTTYHHPVPLSRNLIALTSWNPLGLSRPVMGQLLTCVTVLTVTGLHAGQSGVRITTGVINCSLLQNLQTGSEAHRAFYSMGTRTISLKFKNECRYNYYSRCETSWLGQEQFYLLDICSALWFLQSCCLLNPLCHSGNSTPSCATCAAMSL